MDTTHHVIDFHEDKLEVLISQAEGRNELYISVRPVCEGIGLAWAPQYRKLKEHHRFSQGLLNLGASTTGGEQETLFLEKPKFFLWLYSINPDKVSAEIRPKLVRYQDEAERAIDSYFSHGFAVRTTSDKSTDDILVMISSQAKMISALAQEMYADRGRIDHLESDVGKIKTRLYATPDESPSEEVISPRQAQVLRHLAKDKGKSKTGIMALWGEFKDGFGVDRYVHLPARLFDEAVRWFEGRQEGPRGG